MNKAIHPEAFLVRVAYPMYQKFQRKRWMTRNVSEGMQWKPNALRYSEWKKIKYASFPGGGTKVMIATGRLFQSIIGPSPDHRRIIRGTKMIIGTSVEYASYAGDIRPFFPLSDKSRNTIVREFKKWISQK